MIEYYVFSEKGKGRKQNEDRVFVAGKMISDGFDIGQKNTSLVAGICDGVGSSADPAVAAEMTAVGLKDLDADRTSPLTISRHLHMINRRILQSKGNEITCPRTATTVAGVILHENKYLLFNLGDTHIYEFKDDKMELMTKDHVSIYRNDSEKYKGSGNTGNYEIVLTGYLGGDGAACYPSIKRGIIKDGTILLICSDGFYKGMSMEKLEKRMSGAVNMRQKKETILELVIQNGHEDDLSFVMVRYME